MTREQIIEIMARRMHKRRSEFFYSFEDENQNGYWTEAATAVLTALEAAGLAVVPAEPTLSAIQMHESVKKAAVKADEALKQVRLEGARQFRERAARVAAPKGHKPCECSGWDCDCRYNRDKKDQDMWLSQKAIEAAILSMPLVEE